MCSLTLEIQQTPFFGPLRINIVQKVVTDDKILGVILFHQKNLIRILSHQFKVA